MYHHFNAYYDDYDDLKNDYSYHDSKKVIVDD